MYLILKLGPSSQYEGAIFPVRITFVEDEALRENISAIFREKYGWTDGFLNIFRGSEPLLMRLNPRTPEL